MNQEIKQLVVVVIDDEPQIRKLLQVALTSEQYTVYEAENGTLGLMEVAYRKPDIVLLDLGLPDIDGKDVIRRIREWSTVPVLVLSIREDVREKVEALDAGADDYLVKPFHTVELFARLRVLVRHATNVTAETLIQTGPLSINLSSRTVILDNNEIHCTSTEYALLKLLARNIGKVVTHKQMLREIWGPSNEENTHYIKIYMRQLRKKIEPGAESLKLIINEPGIGYRLRVL
jgi:two-component system KDP operon response regulator KdpE